MDSVKILSKIAVDVVHNLKDTLASKGINAFGGLSNSINYSVSPWLIEISMNQYGEFISEGTKPFTPPIEPLKKWAALRGVNPWAVRASIAKKGIKPNHWMDEFKVSLLKYDEVILTEFGILIEREFDSRLRKVFS